MYTSQLFSQNSDIAVICYDWFCVEYSRVQFDNGNSTNENPPSSPESQAEHFNFEDNGKVRKVWVVERQNNNFSDSTHTAGGLVYNEITSFDNYNFIDGENEDGDNIEYITMNINSDYYAIIESVDAEPQLREKINSKPIFDHLKSKYTLKFFPNPVQSNGVVTFYLSNDVKEIRLINLGTGRKSNVSFNESSNNKYSFRAPTSLGIYSVIVYLEDGVLIKDKLNITK